MREFVFYTEKGYTESPTGEAVENLQILGFINGLDEKDARKKLLRDNSWIIERGFKKSDIFSKEIIIG